MDVPTRGHARSLVRRQVGLRGRDVEHRTRVTELERSLNLQIENIDPGEQVSAFRALVRDEDYTLYQVLQFYVQYRPDPTGGSGLDSRITTGDPTDD